MNTLSKQTWLQALDAIARDKAMVCESWSYDKFIFLTKETVVPTAELWSRQNKMAATQNGGSLTITPYMLVTNKGTSTAYIPDPKEMEMGWYPHGTIKHVKDVKYDIKTNTLDVSMGISSLEEVIRSDSFGWVALDSMFDAKPVLSSIKPIVVLTVDGDPDPLQYLIFQTLLIKLVQGIATPLNEDTSEVINLDEPIPKWDGVDFITIARDSLNPNLITSLEETYPDGFTLVFNSTNLAINGDLANFLDLIYAEGIGFVTMGIDDVITFV